MQELKNVLKFEECEVIEELDDMTNGMIAGIGAAAAIVGIMIALT